MQFLPLVVVFQLILSSVLISIPNLRSHSSSQVLGTQLAQTDSSTNTDTTTPTTDNSSSTDSTNTQNNPSPADQGSASQNSTDNTVQPTDQSPTPSNTDQLESPSPEETTPPTTTSDTENATSIENPASPTPGSPSEQSSPFPTDSSSPQTTPEITPNPSSSPAPTGNPGDQGTQTPALSEQVMTVLDPASVVSNPTVDQNVEQQLQNQNQAVLQAVTPEAKTAVSINSGQQDLGVINNALKKDQFSDVSVVTQDLGQHIDQSLGAINQTPPQQSGALRQNLVSFCTQTDAALRSAEEMVPEELEQDIEINRAKCLNITAQQ